MYSYDYLKEIKTLKYYVLTIPFILLFSYGFYNLAEKNTVIYLGKEDSFFEWMTALFYLIAGILLLLSFKKNKNVFLLLLALVMLFGAGEEMSWGQRVFNFSTPEEMMKVNVQHEFNIHNLAVFNGRDITGQTKQGWSRFLEMDLLFKIFTVVFGVVLPLLVFHFKFVASITQKLKVPVPPISIGIFFLISWVCLKISLSNLNTSVGDLNFYWRVYMAGPEIAEFVGSYIMAMVGFYFYNHRNRNIIGKDFKQL